jgi:hypothetical protein
MKFVPRIAALAAFLILMSAPLAHAGVRDDHPNLIGGELMGRGFILTLNYERFLSNQVGLGAGIMAIGTGSEQAMIMPLYVSFVTGDVHSLYLAAGGALLGAGGSFRDYESTWIMQGSLGYQFQSPGGFFVRPLFTINKATQGSGGGTLVWPGITLGGSF